jgi:hypothetical protein
VVGQQPFHSHHTHTRTLHFHILRIPHLLRSQSSQM